MALGFYLTEYDLYHDTMMFALNIVLHKDEK